MLTKDKHNKLGHICFVFLFSRSFHILINSLTALCPSFIKLRKQVCVLLLGAFTDTNLRTPSLTIK